MRIFLSRFLLNAILLTDFTWTKLTVTKTWENKERSIQRGATPAVPGRPRHTRRCRIGAIARHHSSVQLWQCFGWVSRCQCGPIWWWNVSFGFWGLLRGRISNSPLRFAAQRREVSAKKCRSKWRRSETKGDQVRRRSKVIQSGWRLNEIEASNW